MKKTAIVYWLVPAEPERALLREIIRILAKQYSAPGFEPHLTLFAVPQDRQLSGTVLRKIKAAPIRLKIRGVSYSAKFTKTLFVRFQPNRALEKLAVDLVRQSDGLVLRGRAAGVRVKVPADPHLSLLYKKIPAAAKKQLASTLKLPIREVVFDSIKAVRCAFPTKTAADVAAWRAIAKQKLTS
jgi:2'-5' RNA ligase